jgi:hypothetical protein
MPCLKSEATVTHVHLASARRSQARPRNGDLDFFEELDVTALLYKGQTYGSSQPASPKKCVELTYRREHYNTGRNHIARDMHPALQYRGVGYTK